MYNTPQQYNQIVLEFGFQVGQKATHRFVSTGATMANMYLRIDCNIASHKGKSHATCELSILQHQYDQILSFKDQQAWDDIKYLFERMIVDAIQQKDYIDQCDNS